jgi:hypothetical protein
MREKGRLWKNEGPQNMVSAKRTQIKNSDFFAQPSIPEGVGTLEEAF